MVHSSGIFARRPRVHLARALAVGVLAGGGLLTLGSQVAQATPTPHTALLNADSVTTDDGITDSHGNPISLEQFAAQQAGYTVTVVSGSQWDSMTASQFAQYSLLMIGDPFCGTTPTSAISNSSTWAPVVMGTAGGNTHPGNRSLIGTDPEFHYAEGGGGAQPTNPSDPTTAGAEHLVQAGIAFAGDGPAGTTGLYWDTGCGEEESPGGDIPTLNMLTTTGAGHWTEDTNPPCGGSVQQIATVAEFSIVHDSDLQGWECSVHTSWPQFPADWNAEAVATDTATHPTCGTDPDTKTTACGEAYVILAGQGITSTAPDLSLSPTSATNPVGTDHTVTATVTSPTGAPSSGVVVTFVISSGPNSGATGTCTLSNGTADSTCATGSDGKVKFTYHDTGGAGTDSIDASITVSGTTEHATATKTWATSTGDTTPPTCALTGIGTNGSGQKFINITVKDTGSGLGSVVATKSVNATTSVPAFTSGTTSPVVVTATKVTQSKGSQVALRATDVAGNVTNCDPYYATVRQGKAQHFRRVSRVEHFVSLSSDARSGRVERVRVRVNRTLFTRQLKSGQTSALDVSSAMRGASRNTVQVRVTSPRHARVDVVVADNKL